MAIGKIALEAAGEVVVELLNRNEATGEPALTSEQVMALTLLATQHASKEKEG